MKRQGYLVFDIGTGNARVAIVTTEGEVVRVEREDIRYEREPLYPDSCYFSPDELWSQAVRLAKKAVASVPDVAIQAITSTSQRQGVVLFNEAGQSMIGLPNIDNRGREWEKLLPNPELIYQTTGRLPSALFSALKLYALQKRQPDIWNRIKTFTSISDWIAYQLSGVLVYEPSQATETLLYDVERQEWSDVMCQQFHISPDLLPELRQSGSILGKVQKETAKELGVPEETAVVTGGGDTQLAIESTFAKDGDIVIVSGTTTPICKIIDSYGVDREKRTWTNAHIHKSRWLLETNPGITGLNYQKLKNIFYPHESYEQMEKEMEQVNLHECVAALGMYLSDEKNASKKGGFIFTAPLTEELSRAHFVAAALWEIACAIKWNFDQLGEVAPYERPYVWACGGGFQSKTLAGFIATLLQKDIHVREGSNQASVAGAAAVCNQALGTPPSFSDGVKIVTPNQQDGREMYEEWKQVQQFFTEANVAYSK